MDQETKHIISKIASYQLNILLSIKKGLKDNTLNPFMIMKYLRAPNKDSIPKTIEHLQDIYNKIVDQPDRIDLLDSYQVDVCIFTLYIKSSQWSLEYLKGVEGAKFELLELNYITEEETLDL